MPMNADNHAEQEAIDRTLDHYNARAESFWEGTRDHDVSQNIDALLRNILAKPPFTLLDFGCGPGRDLKTFVQHGHRAIGLEGAHALATMARAHSGCEVWQQDFRQLELPDAYFDGVFANASMFHIPKSMLPSVLQQLCATLKPQGVLFSSNPRGNNEEIIHGERYGAYYHLATWRMYLTAAGFSEIEHYYRPAELPIEQQPWLASVWRRHSE
jgi:SAM-dependent methyltransferase